MYRLDDDVLPTVLKNASSGCSTAAVVPRLRVHLPSVAIVSGPPFLSLSLPMELDLDELKAVRVLGRGATGTVFLVADRSRGVSHAVPHCFALKVVEKSPSLATERRARWEVSVLSRLCHPFLPTLVGRLETPDFLAWAVPYCSGGDLNALRQSQTDGVFSNSAIRFYVSELVLVLAHLHSLGIVYRDLKPENVLIQDSGHITLTDFDLSRQLSPASSSPTSPLSPPPPEKAKEHRRHRWRIFSGGLLFDDQKLDKKKAKSVRVTPASRKDSSVERSDSFVGTEEYVSPEVIHGDGHEFAVDWWALGILTYEMAYGRTPFRGHNRTETFLNVITREPEFVGKQPSELTDLIARLLAKDPARRLGFHGGAEEVKAHTFFNGVQWNFLPAVIRPPFLADDSENQTAALECGGGGFDVRDYYKKLRQPQQQATAPGSPLRASTSWREF
ncbi:unnamed protein product [Spirodela intermedia]|uniref:non-specific serine/threonine protein kinase n=1 Tax=Spirodela intermedia TaxID=51605 RepID=A0A7I8LE85_SPIIN|nr:unnamed protein product [Spirodela intermedia]